jgi:hypothetical protein
MLKNEVTILLIQALFGKTGRLCVASNLSRYLAVLVCKQILEIADQAKQLGEENRQVMLLAVVIQLMQAQGSVLDESSEALFRRLRGRPS